MTYYLKLLGDKDFKKGSYIIKYRITIIKIARKKTRETCNRILKRATKKKNNKKFNSRKNTQ